MAAVLSEGAGRVCALCAFVFWSRLAAIVVYLACACAYAAQNIEGATTLPDDDCREPPSWLSLFGYQGVVSGGERVFF